MKLRRRNVANEEESAPHKRKHTRQLWPYYAVAASVALLVAVFLIFFNNTPTPEELFSANFEPYPALAYAPDRADDQPDSLEKRAFGAYTNGEMPEAIRLLEQLANQEGQPAYWLYLGNAYLADGQAEKAIAALLKAEDQESPLQEQVDWYLALAYLRAGQTEEARAKLEAISNTDSYYREQAKQIFQTL